MLLRLNNGTNIDLPKIEQGTPDTSYTPYTYSNTPFYYYKRYTPAAVFDVLNYFTDAVDALGVSFSRPNDIRNMCASLAAINWHDESYFYPENEGGQMITAINQYVVWILGDATNGGVGMCKIGNKYGFVAFDGVYLGNLDAGSEIEYTYYAYQSSAFEYEGEWRGVFTKTELQHACLVNYTYLDQTEPPIYIFYQPDGWEYSYVSEFQQFGVATYTSYWEHRASIETAMENAAWMGAVIADLKYIPEQPFYCSLDGNKDLSKGNYLIGQVLANEGYKKIGGDLYGNSEVDLGDNPFGYGGTNSNGGGSGKWDGGSNQGGWTEEDQFTTDALNSGFFTLYNPTKPEIQSFNNFLFTDITDSMAVQLKKLISNPLDYVVFMAMCHFSPQHSDDKKPIKFCGLDSGVGAYTINKQNMILHCGSVELIEQNETASFLSYAPYFKAHLYLPYIGMVDINIDEIMDGVTTVQYVIDLLSGSCIAQVIHKRTTKRCGSDIINSKGITIGEYTGNVYQNLPMSATDWRGLFQGIVQFAGGLLSGMTGNASGFGTMASAVMGQKENVSRSGQLGANYGYLGYQKPYFLFERPNIDMPEGYGGFNGWTCNIIKRLRDFKGYTEIEANSWWTDNINGITEEEAQMLKDDFANGVYLNWED